MKVVDERHFASKGAVSPGHSEPARSRGEESEFISVLQKGNAPRFFGSAPPLNDTWAQGWFSMRNPKTRGDAAFRLAVAQRGPGLGLLLDILSFLHTRKCLKMNGIISLWKNGWLVKDCIWAIICDFSGYVFVIDERECKNSGNNIEMAILFKFRFVFVMMID